MMDDILFDFLHMESVELLAQNSDNDSNELCVSRLEHIGYNTGYRFVEKATKEWQRFKDELDVMKFICKEFWSTVFKKQIDNLRTNHMGIYVLLDNRFRFITHMSNSKQYVDQMPKYLAFTCGLIRGALSNLGLNSIVTAEIVSPPSCRFQIQIQRQQ
ncbi:unnamed protein product [Medioppia subpectinata]|uniref:Trafficking protein particle complex subunit 6B n=1 Tax=Medioppia subpectinata TaxID=1979941 RepID=A0A7R9KMW8_9ACAR|nr:unnamed protein product [Medioppia subpectinata]CAG2106506.1 unnamed protein product [Medioppia subpectinata]